jgi:hypothetical protein
MVSKDTTPAVSSARRSPEAVVASACVAGAIPACPGSQMPLAPPAFGQPERDADDAVGVDADHLAVLLARLRHLGALVVRPPEHPDPAFPAAQKALKLRRIRAARAATPWPCAGPGTRGPWSALAPSPARRRTPGAVTRAAPCSPPSGHPPRRCPRGDVREQLRRRLVEPGRQPQRCRRGLVGGQQPRQEGGEGEQQRREEPQPRHLAAGGRVPVGGGGRGRRGARYARR